ncbi:primosomal protein N' [Candidatus Fermentibacteria bacterium]|nr:primosomal protein N' [Candidatus Fermentibacteria bacterium]
MDAVRRPRLIEVAVPRPLTRTLTYSIPPALDGGEIVGCRVLVRLGKRIVTGFVWDVSSEAPRQELRNIEDRIDSAPLLPGPVLRLVRWAASYYAAPPGMMMAAAHPPGLPGTAVRMIMAQDGAVPEGLRDLLPADRAVPVSEVLAESAHPVSTELLIDSLEASGGIRTWWETIRRPPRAADTLLRACGTERELLARAASLRQRAPRQAGLLVLLASAAGKLPLSEARRRTGIGPRSLRALIESGLVAEEAGDAPRERRLPGGPPSRAALPELTAEQSAAVEAAVSPSARGGPAILLHGVTGSGKTEVYERAIAGVLEEGLGAIVLVPEISLTPQLVSRFDERFPGQVAVLHSGLSGSERLEAWNDLRSGRRRIAIGARSAVFAPVPGTGLIVVDEEHDQGYKQAETPRYNARDLAVVRGRLERAAVVLGSATPSLESWRNACRGIYRLQSLTSRIDGRPMPSCRIAAGDESRGDLPGGIADDLARVYAEGGKSIVMINRRGFAPSLVCRACGTPEKCPDCGISLTFHKRGMSLRCHYCGFWKPVPSRCGVCGGGSFSHEGPGVQKVEELIRTRIPGIRVSRLDSDTATGAKSHWEILGGFAGGGSDVLLGTQMVAKGHDFPDVTLVVVLAADMGLSIPDFRAAERVFQLVTQAAGRAGRGGEPGEVIIQATSGHRALEAACRHDYLAFAEGELQVRRALGYPPFSHMVRFLWSGLDAERTERAARASLGTISVRGVSLLGPMQAGLPRIGRRWRWHALARSSSRRALAEFHAAVSKAHEAVGGSAVRLDIDVDPQEML